MKPVSFTYLYFLSGVTYDAIKDQYKTYADGEKVESGSWSDNPHVRILLLVPMLFMS